MNRYLSSLWVITCTAATAAAIAIAGLLVAACTTAAATLVISLYKVLP